MRRQAAVRFGWVVLASGLLHAVLTAYSCGDVGGAMKDVGEPCTRTSECLSGLVCSAGVCRQTDAGAPTDGGEPDAP